MKKQITIFRGFVVTLFSLTAIYLISRHNSHPIFPLLIILIVLLVSALPLFFWTNPQRGEKKWELIFQRVSFYSHGYFSYLFFLTVLRDIGNFFYRFQYNVQESILILILPILFLLLGRVPILMGPFVKKVPIYFSSLNKDLHDLKIIQISDLHIGPGLPFSHVQKSVRIANELEADLIVLTGDIIDHIDKWFIEEINELKKLKAKHGVYFVTGNHEYYWGHQRIVEKVRQLGIKTLCNENVKIKIGSAHLAICGVTDLAARQFAAEGPDFEKAKAGAHDSDFHLLLAHQSKTADESHKFGYDLQLSGHTHNGQFIPWSLIIRIFQKYPKGLYQVGKMKMYVNQGTGYWGPPDRLGTYPEISQIILKNT